MSVPSGTQPWPPVPVTGPLHSTRDQTVLPTRLCSISRTGKAGASVASGAPLAGSGSTFTDWVTQASRGNARSGASVGVGGFGWGKSAVNEDGVRSNGPAAYATIAMGIIPERQKVSRSSGRVALQSRRHPHPLFRDSASVRGRSWPPASPQASSLYHCQENCFAMLRGPYPARLTHSGDLGLRGVPGRKLASIVIDGDFAEGA